MFMINNTLDKFFNECYFNKLAIKYIDSTYAHKIAGGKWHIFAKYKNGDGLIQVLKTNKELEKVLFSLDLQAIHSLKISCAKFDCQLYAIADL